MDVFRGVAEAKRSPLQLVLYILLFPQLIAGPIVRYNEVATQLGVRDENLNDFALGVQRFIVGMAKKMLIANSVALVADRIFDLPATELGSVVAWTGALCYSIQLYFDFSGYSDMAWGLARMFGFYFPEEFRSPVCVLLHHRILAPLAHDAQPLFPGLSVHSARRQPRARSRGRTST